MSENEKKKPQINIEFEPDPNDPSKRRVKAEITENGETYETESDSFETPQSEEKRENEELKGQLVAVAQKQFEDDKEKLYVKLMNLGMEQLAQIAKTATLPSQLTQLEKIVENKQAEMPVPAGCVSLPNYGSKDAYSWRTKNYDSAKEMIDDLYNRLGAPDVSAEEKSQIEKTLSELFKKYRGNATTERR